MPYKKVHATVFGSFPFELGCCFCEGCQGRWPEAKSVGAERLCANKIEAKGCPRAVWGVGGNLANKKRADIRKVAAAPKESNQGIKN